MNQSESRFPSSGCQNSWTPDLHSWGDLLERLTADSSACRGALHSGEASTEKKISTKWKNKKKSWRQSGRPILGRQTKQALVLEKEA